MKTKTVDEQIGTLYTSNTEFSLEEFQTILKSYVDKGATHIIGVEESGYYGDTSYYLSFFKRRPETIEEWKKREEKEKSIELMQTAKEKEYYLKLKEKYKDL